MGDIVDIVIEDDRWQAMGLQALAETAAAATLATLNLNDAGLTFCLMGCDDSRIATLNADFRGKPQPTNVLSWPSQERSPAVDGALPASPLATPDPDLEDPEEDEDSDDEDWEDDPWEDDLDPGTLGDIALSYDTCAREAAEAAKPMADHVTHLVVHGLLHLLGYDHIRDGDAERMEATEVRILARLGLSDPYSA